MSSKASGARRVTLTSQPKGAAAPTRWSPPRTQASYERRAKQRREDLEHVSALGG